MYLNQLAHAKPYFGNHSNSSIIALINFQCVFIRDIAAVKHGAPHGAHGISANRCALDIQLKPVIGKLIVLNNQSALTDKLRSLTTHAAVFHYPILFYSISVTNKGTNLNNFIDVIKSDSVLRAVINLHWFDWRFPIHKSDSVS